jgi:signal transduction histidine kinase
MDSVTQRLLVVGLCILGVWSIGLFVYFKNPRSLLNRYFLFYNLAAGFWNLGDFFAILFRENHTVALYADRIPYIGGVFFIYFNVMFYNALAGHEQLPRFASRLMFSMTPIFSILVLTPFVIEDVTFDQGFAEKPGRLFWLFGLYLVWGVGYGLYLLISAYKKATGRKRTQLQYVLISFALMAFGVLSFASWLFVSNAFPLYYFFEIAYYLALAYAIVKHGVLDIRTVIHKTALWLVTSSVIVVPAFFAFWFLKPRLPEHPVGEAVLLIALFLGLLVYARHVQPRIDHLFQRRKYDLLKILQDFIHEISVLRGLDELVNKLQSTIATVFYPERTAIVLFDVKSEGLKPLRISGLSTSFSIEPHKTFLKWLEQTREVVELDLIETEPRYSEIKDQAKRYFTEVQGKLVVPLTHDGKLLGVISLGEKRNLKPYTTLELDFLANLKVEASIAFSNSLLYDDVSKMSEELRQWAAQLEHKVDDRTRELTESKQEVEMAYAKLQELDRIKSEFFANISHELRTPLTLIMAPVEMLMRRELGPVDRGQAHYLDVMYQNGLRLLKLINNMLDLAKLDAGKMELVLTQGNLGDFVRGIVASVQPMAERKQLRLTYRQTKPLPDSLFDRDKIERVLLNILFNSLKFTEPGGSVEVRCVRENGHVQLSVEDTGVGISKSHLPHIFERFSQADSSASRKHEGTGLGLALARELVELHGGRMWAESDEGQGTIMTLLLPIQTDPSTPPAPLSRSVIERRQKQRRRLERRGVDRRLLDDWTRSLHVAAEYSTAGVLKEWTAIELPTIKKEKGVPKTHRLLLVEDNPDMLNFLSFQLQDEFELLMARDGIEGLERARREIPDLIVSDVMMPGKDGYQLCREIKQDQRTCHIPVVLLTAKAELSGKIEGLEYGADEYLTKPFNAQELRAKVRSLISLRRLEREVQRRNEELERTLKELQDTQAQLIHSEKMATLGLLVAGIAHEINNPVSFAKGSLSNLRRYLKEMRQVLERYPETRRVLEQFSDLVSDMDRSLQIVKTGLDRTENIVQDLKVFARKDEPYFKPTDLHEGLNSTLKLLQAELEAPGRGIINVEKEYGPIPQVETIPGQINQVFMNLLSNAVQAVRAKGEKAEGTVRIRTRQEDGCVTIAIRDDGIGIEKDQLGRVFEPFFTTKPVQQGTGLGLSVSARIVEQHGGRMTVESGPGKGSTFTVTLPIQQARTARGGIPSQAPAEKVRR